MTSKDKTIKRLKHAKSANFQDIHALLLTLGFKWRCSGSHYTYTKAHHVIVIVKRSGKPVKRVYLEMLNDLLRRLEEEAEAAKAEAANKDKEREDKQ
ncbi:MAG: hypothetical protein M0Z41_19050 [Peptococcaceae bacterium]|jgi:predicted RNA binding protein YcfA (HicA-like mRNA interferase family)|nr:hypothetical protein [Peptococcaceae bacterium]